MFGLSSRAPANMVSKSGNRFRQSQMAKWILCFAVALLNSGLGLIYLFECTPVASELSFCDEK